MKKLIILLSIASSIIGQVDNEKYLREIDSLMQKMKYIPQMPSTSMDSLTATRISWLDEFIELYSEYEAECKVDSFESGWWTVVFEDETTTSNSPLIGKIKPIFTKGRMVTFQGFIEFLSEKKRNDFN